MKEILRVGNRLFYSPRLWRVATIGGVGLVIQTAVFELLSTYLDVLSPSSAVLVGGEIAILCNFFLNNHFSFRDRLPDAAPLIIRLLRFHLVIMGSLFIQWLFVFSAERVTTDLLLIHAAYFAGVGVGFISNFSGYYFWVWRRHADAPASSQSQAPKPATDRPSD